jgi:hypothetical protein
MAERASHPGVHIFLDHFLAAWRLCAINYIAYRLEHVASSPRDLRGVILATLRRRSPPETSCNRMLSTYPPLLHTWQMNLYDGFILILSCSKRASGLTIETLSLSSGNVTS